MIPVFLQVLPLLSGVMYAVEPDPGEVAVDPRVQPDDDRDQRLALGGDRRTAARTRARLRSASRVAVVLFVFGLAVFRSSEPRFADTI